MLAASATELRSRSRRLARRLAAAVGEAARIEVVAEPSTVGGGALPLTELPGFAVAVAPQNLSVDALAARLRTGTPPVVGRIQEGRLLLNPRTIARSEEEDLLRAVADAFSQ
jgi:L-seryl-tRNA(Ser) seleniumtransferase